MKGWEISAGRANARNITGSRRAKGRKEVKDGGNRRRKSGVVTLRIEFRIADLYGESWMQDIFPRAERNELNSFFNRFNFKATFSNLTQTLAIFSIGYILSTNLSTSFSCY